MELLESRDSGADTDIPEGGAPPATALPKTATASLEQQLAELEEIVSSLESPDLGLEQMLETFERGLQVSSACRAQLDRFEQKIRQLVENQTELTEVEAGNYTPKE